MISLFGLIFKSITSLLALGTIRDSITKMSVPRDGGLKVSRIIQVDICTDDRPMATGSIKLVKAA